MDGKAAKWLQVYKLKYGLGNWDSFIQAVEEKFGDNDYREALTQLLEFQQIDSLESYISAFEDLQYQLIMHNSGLDELFFTTQFIKGLKPELSSVVQAQVPDTLARAELLAKIQQVLDRGKGRWPRNSSWAKQPQQQAKPEVKSNATPNLWKERHIRDFRKANGPFDAQHKNICPKRPQDQVNALVVNDLDVILNDDVLNQLAMEVALAEGFCQLSLNAIAGTYKGDALRVRALVHNKVMLILVDSGSSHSFVSKPFVETTGLQAMPTTPKQVKLPNGDIMVTDQWIPQLEW